MRPCNTIVILNFLRRVYSGFPEMCGIKSQHWGQKWSLGNSLVVQKLWSFSQKLKHHDLRGGKKRERFSGWLLGKNSSLWEWLDNGTVSPWKWSWPASVKELFGQLSYANGLILSLPCVEPGAGLSLMGPFQLRILHDSVILWFSLPPIGKKMKRGGWV